MSRQEPLPRQQRIARRAVLQAGAFALTAVIASACGADSWLRSRLSAERPQGDWYVAPNGNDAWSGKLPRPNLWRSDGPFATLSRAQRAVQEAIAGGMSADIRVLIRGGIYYVPGSLVFGPADGGGPQQRITYAAYPGEEPVLVGGVRLMNWRRYRGEVWETDIPAGYSPAQLFENGTRMSWARAPKEGYFQTETAATLGDKGGFEYRPEDLDGLDPGAWGLSGALVSIWPQYNWFNHEKRLVALDADRHTIALEGEDGYPITPHNRYYVKNVLALLTQPGECQIDLLHRKVYCWPRNNPIEEQTIIISTAENVVRLEGQAPDRPLRNLHLLGLDLAMANSEALYIGSAEDCSVRFCRIEHGYDTGVRIAGHAQRIELYGNLIRYHGYCGVSLEGLGLGQADANHHNRVENNHIHHCGQVIGHGAGVYIQQSGHNQILHNHIHHTPRYGTTIKGLEYQTLKSEVPGVTWENHYDLLHSRNNVIAYNDIHHANLDSQDTGAMESWGPGRDNIYDHNLVHDSGNTEFDIQSGIYLDDATDHFTVTNNVIWGIVGTSGNQCIFSKGIGNRIENNILIMGPKNDGGIASMEMGGDECRDHVYLRNIFVMEDVYAGIYRFINWRDDRVKESDYNLFWKDKGPIFVTGAPSAGMGYGELEEWKKILHNKYDQHSIVADPLFVDASQRDYRLQPDSPALALGFQDITIGAIGLEEDYPSRFERD